MAEKEKDSPSQLKKVVVAAPLVAGFGIGIRNMLRSTQLSSAFKFENPLKQQANLIHNFAATLEKNTVNYEQLVQQWRAESRYTKDAIQLAWESATSNLGKSAVVKTFQEDDPFAAIEFFARRNQGYIGTRVLDKFKANLEALTETYADSPFPSFDSPIPYRARSMRIESTHIADAMVRGNIEGIQETLRGLGYDTDIILHSRSGFRGQQLGLQIFGGALGGKGVVVDFPTELKAVGSYPGAPGVISTGTGLQTRYIAGKYGIVDPQSLKIKQVLSHEQFVTKYFAELVAPKLGRSNISGREIRGIVSEFHEKMRSGLEWLPTLPKGVMTSLAVKEKIAAHRMRLMFDPAATSNVNLSPEQLGKVIEISATDPEAIRLFPQTSAQQLSEGTVSTFDFRQLMRGGEMYPIERAPGKPFGRIAQPSASAISARLAAPIRKEFSWLTTNTAKEFFGDTPMDFMSRIAYISETRASPELASVVGGSLGGAGVVSSTTRAQRDYITNLQINLDANNRIHRGLLEVLKARKVSEGVYDIKDLSEELVDQIIGFDDKGEPVKLTRGMTILGGFQYENRGQSRFRIHGIQQIEPELTQKMHGSAKVALREVTPTKIREFLSGTGVNPHETTMLQNIDTVIGMDELRKNRSLHNMQLLTSLQDFLPTSYRSKYQTHAINILNLASKTNDSGAVMQATYHIARKHKLDPFAIGRVFGAVPDVIGSDWQTKLAARGMRFSSAEVEEIMKPIAFGVGQFYYEGASTAGVRSGIEPRLLELLQGPQYGTLGPKLAEDIMSRMMLANPEVVKEQGILQQALNLLKGNSISGKQEVYSLKTLSNQDALNQLFETGGIVDLGGYSNVAKRLFVPAESAVTAMRQQITDAGLVIPSTLKQAYGDVIKIASRKYAGEDISRSEIDRMIYGLTEELGAAHAGTITGKNFGLARGKVQGSRYLRAIADIHGQLGDLVGVGISKKTATNMFRDLERLYKNDQEELVRLAEMKRKLFAGERVGGVAWRHPGIGAFSARGVQMEIVSNLGNDEVLLPLKPAMADIFDVTGKKIDTKQLDLSFFAGMAGDYDGDNVDIMLASSGIQKDIDAHYSSTALNELEQNYILRQQLIRPKAFKSAKEISPLLEETSGAVKLAAGKSKIGPLSVPMSKIRAAVTQSFKQGLFDKSRYLSAMSLAEAIEQGPISGKQVDPEKVSKFIANLNTLTEATTQNKAAIMESVVRDTFEDNKIVQELFERGLTANINGKQYMLDAINVSQSIMDMTRSVERMHNFGLNENTMRSVLLGNRGLKFNEIEDYLNYSGGLLKNLKITSQGVGATASRVAQSVRNQVINAGGEILSNMSKPLALGFGASIALATALSKPGTSLELGASSAPMSNGRIASANNASRNVTPESVHPDSGISGEPTTSGSIPPRKAYINNEGNRPGYNIKVRGKSANRNATNNTQEGLNRMFGRSNRTNINTRSRDDRKSLTPQSIDDMIRR